MRGCCSGRPSRSLISSTPCGIPLCEAALVSETTSDIDRYWVEATMAEAYLGVGDEEVSATWLARVMAEPLAEWMRE